MVVSLLASFVTGKPEKEKVEGLTYSTVKNMKKNNNRVVSLKSINPIQKGIWIF